MIRLRYVCQWALGSILDRFGDPLHSEGMNELRGMLIRLKDWQIRLTCNRYIEYNHEYKEEGSRCCCCCCGGGGEEDQWMINVYCFAWNSIQYIVKVSAGVFARISIILLQILNLYYY